MNSRLLKAKRMERDRRQKDLADVLHITEKSMCQKECSSVNKFKAEEMLAIADDLGLTLEEFDSIFFDNRLSKLETNITKNSQMSKERVELKSQSGKLRAVWMPEERKLEIVKDKLQSTFHLHPDTNTYDVEDMEIT